MCFRDSGCLGDGLIEQGSTAVDQMCDICGKIVRSEWWCEAYRVCDNCVAQVPGWANDIAWKESLAHMRYFILTKKIMDKAPELKDWIVDEEKKIQEEFLREREES